MCSKLLNDQKNYFCAANKDFSGSNKIGNYYFKGLFIDKKKIVFAKKGYVLGYSDEELIKNIKKKGFEFIKNLKGQFFIIYYDIEEDEFHFGNDCFGRETLFYYTDKKDFIISNDFWQIINLVNPDISNIDMISVKEFILFGFSLFENTIIKHLKILPPASLVKINNDYIMNITNYFDRIFGDYENLTIDEAVEKVDAIIDDYFKEFKENNKPDTVYGVGLSGGLDSRLLPYYAKNNAMKLKAYMIADKRSKGLFESMNVKLAKKTAKYYNLNLNIIEQKSETFENKMFYDVRYAPCIPSQVPICVRSKVSDVDILITGTCGYGIGLEGDCEEIKNTSKEEFKNKMIENFIQSKNPHIISNLFNDTKNIDNIDKISKFIEENNEKTNLQIFLKLKHFLINSKNRYGTYESLNGYLADFPIYLSLLNTVTYRYPYELIERRPILLNLINKKKGIPSLKKIPSTKLTEFPLIHSDQEYTNMFKEANNKSFFQNVLKLFKIQSQKPRPWEFLRFLFFAIQEHILRGNGDWNREKSNKTYKNEMYKTLLNPNSYLNNIFQSKTIISHFEKGRIDSKSFLQIVKIKRILDLIESKNYKKFFD